MIMKLSVATAAALLLLGQSTTVVASNTPVEFEGYLTDPIDILLSLEKYQTLWLQPHGCVWSECAIDDTDDLYKGDYRDGDELWYQYRTQPFCANAGFSLFATEKKKDKEGNYKQTRSVPEWKDSFNTGCRKGRYLNSYFTYGGADNLLLAVGQTPQVYYAGYEGNNRKLEDQAAAYDDGYYDAYAANDDGNNNNNNNDDDSYYTNAMCVDVDGTGITHYSYNADGEGGGGNSQDEYYYTSTMGCSAQHPGKFTIARFESYVCDGTDYVDDLDELEDYNALHDAVGCTRLWDAAWEESGNFNATADLVALLQSSWACNLEMYPDECPDPYELKAKHEHALLTASRGGNGNMSYRTMMAQKPFHTWSMCLVILGTILFTFGWSMKNYVRAREMKKKYLIIGYAVCALSDICATFVMFWTRMKCMTCKRTKKKKRGAKKSTKSSSNASTNSDEERRAALLPEEDAGDEEATSASAIQSVASSIAPSASIASSIAPSVSAVGSVDSVPVIPNAITSGSIPIDERETDVVIAAAKTPDVFDEELMNDTSTRSQQLKETSERSKYFSSHSRD